MQIAMGQANIGRKVAATLGICLKEVSRGALITPLKVLLWSYVKNPPDSSVGSIKNLVSQDLKPLELFFFSCGLDFDLLTSPKAS
jgi:hypothetical protein